MYIKDRLSVIERVFLRKKYTKKHVFFCLFVFCCCFFFLLEKKTFFFFCFSFFYCFFFLFTFFLFTFSAKMCRAEKSFFSNITYKEGRFYQKRSELDF